MISIVHPYYNHKETFAYQFNQWSMFSRKVKANIEIVVVDDGSPVYPCLPPADLKGIDLKIMRVEEDIRWNTAGAANLGVTVSKYDWILHADFDVGLPPWCADALLALDLSNPKVVYWPMTWHETSRGYQKYGAPHCNSYLMNKNTYWEAGGYDEDFSGCWGCQDSLFHKYSCKPLNLIRKELQHVVLERMIRCKDAKVQGVWRDRGDSINWQKLYDKMEGKTPQSKDYLRFKWHQVYP